jgi:hypothetical protein|mmetsp:Transcript_68790/g.153532  ORF Transcript_68790/g.153532 Transcript_68790/m.153532 type:complete len:99 (+) Transcript_68790:38-334(+)
MASRLIGSCSEVELPLSQSCRLCGRKPPRFLFFALSGSICNAAQLAIDKIIMLFLPEVWWAPTLCWTLSYALSVALRHTSHAIIGGCPVWLWPVLPFT